MTNEEAIKNLKEHKSVYTNCAADAEANETIEMAIKALEQEPKWIPVSERLPEKSGNYTVTEKVFGLDDREHKGRYNTMVEQVEYCNGKWQRARFFEVTAWMPLPEPYKAESEVSDADSN